MKRLMNHIGGEELAPASGKWFQHRNPSTGENSSEVPDSEFLDVVKAIQAANKALSRWEKSDVSERAKYLNEIARLFDQNLEELAKLQSQDQGMPLNLSRGDSLPRVGEIFRFYARLILDERTENLTNSKSITFTHRLPIGVVGVITPWSDPLVSMALRVAPALAAGNTVILKPSEFAPESADAFMKIVLQAGLPAGVLNLVQGRGESAGQALVQHPGLSTIGFTGRTETGQAVLRESVELLKKTQLSLGARNPVLIFADTDFKKLMPKIISTCFQFHGMTCLRGSRVFVQDPIYKEFLAAFAEEVAKLQVGNSLDEKTDLGPVRSSESLTRYQVAIDQAIKENGKILVGGPDESRDLFARPTVIQDLTLCSTLQQEEIIGPFVTVTSFKYQHDAVKQANNSPLGQAAYVFHADGVKSMRVATKIEAGRVYVNSGAPWVNSSWDERMSFGGLKTSGLGREGAVESLRFFSREVSISQGIMI